MYDDLNFNNLYEQYIENVCNNTRTLIITVEDDNLQRVLFDVYYMNYNIFISSLEWKLKVFFFCQ